MEVEPKKVGRKKSVDHGHYLPKMTDDDSHYKKYEKDIAKFKDYKIPNIPGFSTKLIHAH